VKKQSAKRTVRDSSKASAALVARLGGRLTAASGAGLEKGDARVQGRFRIETKRPPTGHYRLTFQDWEKIRDAALRANEIPVFHLMLGHEEIIALREEDYIGLGGKETNIGNLGRAPCLGQEMDAHVWIGLLVVYRHAQLKLNKGTKTYTLRLMPAVDFIQLATESA